MSSVSRRDLLGGSVAGLWLARADAGEKSTQAAGDGRTGTSRGADPGAVRIGGVQTVRIDGRYNVWLKRIGTQSLPVLMLHGGPGWNHFYYECFEDFLPAAGLSFYHYDQLGCGFSDVPKEESLWTVERYVEEVEQVRRALGEPRLLLYGHSWGAMLAMEYAVRYPQHLAALVLSNMSASIPSYREYSEHLIRTLLSPAAQAAIAQARASGKYDAPEYQQAVQELYDHTLCRIHPWPEPILRSVRFANPDIYRVMCGPSDLDIAGNLKNWDMWSRLPRISAPTLVIAGRYDEMDPDQLRRMSSLIPHSKFVICQNGAHFAMYDDQQAYFNALIPFVRAHARLSAA